MKTLMIQDDVYRMLKKMKGGRSFSELLRDMASMESKTKDIVKMSGCLKGDPVLDELEKIISENRKKFGERNVHIG